MTLVGTDRVGRGSVRVVRTFRLMPDGALAPITRRPAWSDGVNTASCHRGGPDRGHVAPEPRCRCGLWGYGSLQALRDSAIREQARVVAVVSCYGRVIPGSLGVRAQHAVIEAVWVSPEVDAATRRRVAARYPAAALYASLPAMLGEHPLSVLPSYRLPAAPRPAAVRAQLVATAVWWLGMLGWAVAGQPSGPQPADVAVTAVAAAALAAPMAIAVLTALLVLTGPRRWPWALGALALQTALAVLSRAALPEWVAFHQLTALAGAAGTLHVAVAARAWWLLLRLDVRGAGWRRWPGLPR